MADRTERNNGHRGAPRHAARGGAAAGQAHREDAANQARGNE